MSMILEEGERLTNISEVELREIELESHMEILQERLAELEFRSEDAGWIRFGGEYAVEFSLQHLKSIVARSRLYYLNNPLINRAVSLQADYVFAQGLNIQATDKLVNEVIQGFIDDKLNNRELMGHKARLLKEQTLMLDGNVFFVLFTNKINGKVQIRTILVDEIVDIITNPDDANEVWYYKREWLQKNSDNRGGSELQTAYYPDIDYKSNILERPRTIGGKPINWDAPIYHVKVGELAKSRYGVPEVYAALDWAQAHRQFLQDWATIVRAYARFAFKLTLSGNKDTVAAAKTRLGTTQTAASAIERNAPPVTGSIFTATKDSSDITPIRTAGATTNAQDGREIRMMVAAALGIPDTFFGDVDVGNLATARTLDRPTELKFRSRQQLWTDVYQNILNYVIGWAIQAPRGKLHNKVRFTIEDGILVYKPTSKVNLHIEVVFPPILEHSIIDRISAVSNAVTLNGKTFAIDSPELTKLTIRLMLQALGVQDVDEITEKIFKDVDIEKDAADKLNNNPKPEEEPNVRPEPGRSDPELPS